MKYIDSILKKTSYCYISAYRKAGFITNKISVKLKKIQKYRSDLNYFIKVCDWIIQKEPKLDDADQTAGLLGEYFWQDLLIAKLVIDLKPHRHIDIGSRIDGFIAHLACTRNIEVFDIRPLPEKIPGVNFHQVDIMNLPSQFHSSADCVTCLHSIEHFGLGRYGDLLDHDGWKSGLKNLSLLLSNSGKLIISTPVGAQRVKFNAHRIFNPNSIIEESKKYNLQIESFYSISNLEEPSTYFEKSDDIFRDFKKIQFQKYSLGIFVFKKVNTIA
jgi:hypothetical protein